MRSIAHALRRQTISLNTLKHTARVSYISLSPHICSLPYHTDTHNTLTHSLQHARLSSACVSYITFLLCTLRTILFRILKKLNGNHAFFSARLSRGTQGRKNYYSNSNKNFPAQRERDRQRERELLLRADDLQYVFHSPQFRAAKKWGGFMYNVHI